MSCGSCGVVFEQNSKTIRCESCWLWFHLACAGLVKIPRDEDEFKCRKCVRQNQNLLTHFLIFSRTLEEQNNESAIYLRRQALQKLPKFKGDPIDWPRFRSIYEETNLTGGFTDVENSTRLLEALEGPAKTLVQSKLINPESVGDSWRLLELTYGNPNIIYDKLIAEVVSAKSPKDGQRTTFIEFATKVSNLVSNLKALKQEAKLKDSRLIRDLLLKLPLHLQDKWLDYTVGKDDADVSVFDLFLTNRLEKLLRLPLPTKDVPSTSGARGSVFIQSQQESYDSRIKNCHLCNQNGHKIEFCAEFLRLNVKARWEKVKELKLCFACFGKSFHRLKDCRYSKQCGVNGCQRKHHQLLHESSPQSQFTIANCNTEEKPIHKKPVTYSLDKLGMQKQTPKNFAATENNLLFMVLPVTLHNKDKKVETYAFLDPGSSFTLIDSSLADELELDGTPEPLSLLCAKGIVAKDENSRLTSFKISAKSKDREFDVAGAKTVTNLNLPKSTQDMEALQNQYPHLKGISLPTFCEVTPKLLIGVDNSYLLAYHSMIEREKDVPIAVKTRLGWCIFGKYQPQSSQIAHTFVIRKNSPESYAKDFAQAKISDEEKKDKIVHSDGSNIQNESEKTQVAKILDSAKSRKSMDKVDLHKESSFLELDQKEIFLDKNQPKNTAKPLWYKSSSRIKSLKLHLPKILRLRNQPTRIKGRSIKETVDHRTRRYTQPLRSSPIVSGTCFWRKANLVFTSSKSNYNKLWEKEARTQVKNISLISNKLLRRNQGKKKRRLTKLYFRKDGVASVALIYSNYKTYKRPTLKLAKLDVNPVE